MNTQSYIHDELEKLLKSGQRFTRVQDSLGLLVRREVSQVISPREDKVFVTEVYADSTTFNGGFNTLEEAYQEATKVLNHGVILQIDYKMIFSEEKPLSDIEKLARCAHIAVQKPRIPNKAAARICTSILESE